MPLRVEALIGEVSRLPPAFRELGRELPLSLRSQLRKRGVHGGRGLGISHTKVFSESRSEEAIAATPYWIPDLENELEDLMIAQSRCFVDPSVEIDIGGRMVRLEYLVEGHTVFDLVVRISDAPVVFAGGVPEGRDGGSGPKRRACGSLFGGGDKNRRRQEPRRTEVAASMDAEIL